MRLNASLKMLAVLGALVIPLVATLVTLAVVNAAPNLPANTYIVVFDPSSKSINARSIRDHRGTILKDFSQAGVFVVSTQRPSDLSSLSGVTIAKDSQRRIVPDKNVTIKRSHELATGRVNSQSSSQGCASTDASCPLQWDLERINVPDAWKVTQGSSRVKVAVLDTGVASTHEEVGSNYNIAESKSFVQPNEYCSADATTYDSLEDFQGHGTWTSLHVAGKNGMLMTGIAPKTTLLNVRVLGSCGIGLDSWILDGMLYANRMGAAIISVSLGGYSCGLGVISDSYYCGNTTSVGDDPVIYKAYQQVIRYLLVRGTVVIASAGNEHVEVDARGMVTSHGSLAVTGELVSDPSNDLYGLTEVPAGIPGVISVAAVNRVTAPAAAGETRYGQFGAGLSDQLAYYSNYGESIAVSAPGGARNYNVPLFDCMVSSSNCTRLDSSSKTSTDNPGDFGAWGVNAVGEPCNDCYVNVQGTSMAAPQVAGVAALMLAAHPSMPAIALTYLLRRSVTPFESLNATPAIETDSKSPNYLYNLDYDGRRIDKSLMGRGVIDAALAVRHPF